MMLPIASYWAEWHAYLTRTMPCQCNVPSKCQGNKGNNKGRWDDGDMQCLSAGFEIEGRVWQKKNLMGIEHGPQGGCKLAETLDCAPTRT